MTMPKRALAEHRPWLLLSLLAGISYFFVSDASVPGLYLMVWKGLGVAFLAAYAWRRTRGANGFLIGLVMALGAAGDVGIELHLLLGAALFAVAHLVAIALYARNRRDRVSQTDKLTALALAAFTPLLAWLITYPQPDWHLAVIYAALLGVMAAAAWNSRFSRSRVGLGAILFILSDLVILMQQAGKMEPEAAGWLIWPMYYSAQFLIATGAVQRLRTDQVPG